MSQHLKRLQSKVDQLCHLSELLDGLSQDLNQANDEVQLEAMGQPDLPLGADTGEAPTVSVSVGHDQCGHCGADRIAELERQLEEQAEAMGRVMEEREALRVMVKELEEENRRQGAQLKARKDMVTSQQMSLDQQANDCIAYRAAMNTALKQLGDPKCCLETRQRHATTTLSQTLEARERATDHEPPTTDEPTE